MSDSLSETLSRRAGIVRMKTEKVLNLGLPERSSTGDGEHRSTLVLRFTTSSDSSVRYTRYSVTSQKQTRISRPAVTTAREYQAPAVSQHRCGYLVCARRQRSCARRGPQLN
jgi:hypothetical protein